MTQEARESAAVGQLAVFHRLVANTGVASVTNNFIWFAVTFWAYLETKSVLATAIIGGTYMLLLAGSALLFGTFVDGHRRKTSMLVSSAGSLVAYLAAAAFYGLASDAALRDLGSPMFWGLLCSSWPGPSLATSGRWRCPPRSLCWCRKIGTTRPTGWWAR